MGGVLTQLFPGRPHFTEANVDSLQGKVFIVTGGNSGVGYELVKILYAKGARIYVAGRSKTKITSAIEGIKEIPTETPGELKSLIVDFNDMTTIAACARDFLAQESRLDVLWNNAGVSMQPPGSTSVQGYERHMAVNCLGPYLLTKLLLPILKQTVQISPEGSVRVVWATSGIVDMSPVPGGLSLEEQQSGKHAQDMNHNYSASKAGNWFLASELDKRVREAGVVSVAQSPGTLRTAGMDKAPFLMRAMLSIVMHPPKMGAYTELWAGLSRDVTIEDGARFIIPWGRWHPSPRKDCLESLKSKKEGGTGLAADFWDWCEEQTKSYV
ncbi:hypothetical protein PRZ48_007215 [Zasmidium cellare]|uniref:Short-chain dehydrogenase n=1 Tax=Zasmidium cellare TaxID=395010 RepID=A0ABR0EIQ3_ZASCE|nr:hypothetical protein PRZ48_007215 [Zasmidium cellare]